MKWMKERDLLIAQTMAFVQSVTGKTPEAEKTPEVEKTVTRRLPCSPSRHPKPPARPRSFPTLSFCWRVCPPLPSHQETYQERFREKQQRRYRGRYRRRPRLRVSTCGRNSRPRSGRGSPISAPIRSGSPANARPIAARPWRRSTLRSGKANSQRRRSITRPPREANSPRSSPAPAADASETPAGPRSSESGQGPS